MEICCLTKWYVFDCASSNPASLFIRSVSHFVLVLAEWSRPENLLGRQLKMCSWPPQQGNAPSTSKESCGSKSWYPQPYPPPQIPFEVDRTKGGGCPKRGPSEFRIAPSSSPWSRYMFRRHSRCGLPSRLPVKEPESKEALRSKRIFQGKPCEVACKYIPTW